MSLSIEDVKRVAHLARIDITDAEAADVRTKLGGLFRLIEQMRAVKRAIDPEWKMAPGVLFPPRGL